MAEGVGQGGRSGEGRRVVGRRKKPGGKGRGWSWGDGGRCEHGAREVARLWWWMCTYEIPILGNCLNESGVQGAMVGGQFVWLGIPEVASEACVV